MLNWLTRRGANVRKADEIYGTVVAQARRPGFYVDAYGVPDTLNGRYELVVLHLFLMLERIQAEPAMHEISRSLVDRFCVDMDDCMREMGVGDLTVPKKVKRAAAGFYERARAYRAGLADPSPDCLDEALQTFIAGPVSPEHLGRNLGQFVRSATRALAAADIESVVSGAAMPAPDGRAVPVEPTTLK
ncbi:MAG: ubiquinol-cytochrome C chaperone [Hyphomicrobiaceae bacterium]|nr:ubiquinol-cytochrome C chaperone [Hyphomicrobiaceae bacterium]